MGITIDGREVSCNPNETVGDFLQAVLKSAETDKRRITGISINETPIMPEDIENWSDATVGALTSLSVTTASTQELLQKELTEIVPVLDDMEGVFAVFANLFRQTNPEAGLLRFQETLSVLDRTVSVLKLIHESLPKLQSEQVEALVGQINTGLTTMADCLEKQDYITMADVLEFEVQAQVNKLKQYLNSLRVRRDIQ